MLLIDPERTDPMQSTIVGVRFTKVGKVYHFDASNTPDVKLGDSVVVETSRGWQLGKVAQILQGDDVPLDDHRKAIDRMATPRDLLIRQSWQRKEASVIEECRKRVVESGITGIKVVAAEYSFDGSRLSILFNSDSEEKADVKNLRQDMQKQYAPAQVELRQIGPRDVAKILGGMGACGLENRCCSQFLTDFSSISIRMAKEQNISLTPTEITGMCGRLRCCLIYEYEQYVEARKSLPKRNKRVITPQGEGRVVDVLILKESVIVEIPEVGRREFTKDEVEPADELERLQKKAQNPCGEDGGGCGGACSTKKK
jgi:cell fate regulator YaaT (PSP1 superfamily)